jgi:hypothetical protein
MKIMVQVFADERLRMLPTISVDRARMADPCHRPRDGPSRVLTGCTHYFPPAGIGWKQQSDANPAVPIHPSGIRLSNPGIRGMGRFQKYLPTVLTNTMCELRKLRFFEKSELSDGLLGLHPDAIWQAHLLTPTAHGNALVGPWRRFLQKRHRFPLLQAEEAAFHLDVFAGKEHDFHFHEPTEIGGVTPKWDSEAQAALPHFRQEDLVEVPHLKPADVRPQRLSKHRIARQLRRRILPCKGQPVLVHKDDKIVRINCVNECTRHGILFLRHHGSARTRLRLPVNPCLPRSPAECSICSLASSGAEQVPMKICVNQQ